MRQLLKEAYAALGAALSSERACAEKDALVHVAAAEAALAVILQEYGPKRRFQETQADDVEDEEEDEDEDEDEEEEEEEAGGR